MSELGLEHEPTSMLEMDAPGRGVVPEEPPPAYNTLDQRRLPVPVEMGTETGRAAVTPEVRAGDGGVEWCSRGF